MVKIDIIEESLIKADLNGVYKSLDPGLASSSNMEKLIKSASCNSRSYMTIVNFKNFLGGTYFGKFTESELRYAFDLLDTNKDGYLDEFDLGERFQQLNWGFSSLNLIDFDEFKKLMNENWE